jgi:two-component system sensor histidine kinase HydH
MEIKLPMNTFLSKEGSRLRSLLRYLPVVSIVLVAGTLLVIVVLLTLRTINTQTRRLEEFTERLGLSVIRGIEAGTRSGFADGEWWGIGKVQSLVEQAAKDPDVDWVGLADAKGRILVHSDPSKVGTRLESEEDLKRISAVIRSEEPLSLKREIGDGKQVFEIWKMFKPFEDLLAQEELVALHTIIGKELLNAFAPDKPENKQVLFVALKMDRIAHIRYQDIVYAVLMGLVLFVIGLAGIYFIILVQNYVLTRRTLEEMRTYTRNVLESMPNGLLTVGRNKRVATFNPKTLDILDRHKEEVEGRLITELLPLEKEIDEVLVDAEAILEKRLKIATETKGKIFLAVSVSSLQVPDSEESRGAVVILRDMTVIRELEQKVALSEKFAALGRLSAGVAHEIRNPLNSIRGFIQYFQKKLKLREEDYEYTELMLNEVDRLNRVISKLLAYSKPREPRLGIRSIEEIIAHSVQVVRREAGDAGVDIVVNPDEGASPLVLMDTDQMTQVFLNLLINAVEAMPDGGTVTIGYVSQEDGQLTITIEDTGEGINRDDMDKLFDPFFSTKKKGTGLGLAIVKSIIEGHQGDVEAESEPGKGTRFVITLKTFQASEEDTLIAGRAGNAPSVAESDRPAEPDTPI